MGSIKKWAILFSILILPYLIVVILENATHNILTLGYVEKTTSERDSLGKIVEYVDSMKVPVFTLMNQDQKYISNDDLIGYNYVVNFFFTSCPGICGPTTANLIHSQKKIHDSEIDNFKIISISVDPENDTPEKMKHYADSIEIDLSNWEFLVGSELSGYIVKLVFRPEAFN